MQNVLAFISKTEREIEKKLQTKNVIVHNRLLLSIYYDWNEQQTTKTMLGRVQYAVCYSSKSKARHDVKLGSLVSQRMATSNSLAYINNSGVNSRHDSTTATILYGCERGNVKYMAFHIIKQGCCGLSTLVTFSITCQRCFPS